MSKYFNISRAVGSLEVGTEKHFIKNQMYKHTQEDLQDVGCDVGGPMIE